MKIKRGDQVVVISGVHAGDSPRRVTEVIDGGEKLLVEGVNLVFRHVKRGHPYCDKCQKGVRLGYRFTADGSKERFCKKCSAAAGTIAPSRKSHAKAK